MNRTIAPNFGKQPTPRLRRFCCMLTALIGIFWLTVGPAQAEPVQINRVVQSLRTVQGTTDIQLSLISQDPVNGGAKTPTQTSGPAPGIGSSDPKLDVLLSGFPIVGADLDLGVDDVEDGEVDGSICDCGEILIAGGGFPKWPLLFLAAVPLAFIPDCDDCEQNEPTPTPTPTPPSTPTPTPTPTPEPASLLLFGSGLAAFGAGLRHRYKKTKLANQIQETEEEQS
jgi:PEP-CTERM motif-containing protein